MFQPVSLHLSECRKLQRAVMCLLSALLMLNKPTSFMYSILLIPSHPGGLHWTHSSVSVSFIGKAFAKPQWFPLKPCLQSVPIPQDSSPVPHISNDAPQFVDIHNSAGRAVCPLMSCINGDNSQCLSRH